jgi:pseudouridine-5'-phosphate glycosidase
VLALSLATSSSGLTPKTESPEKITRSIQTALRESQTLNVLFVNHLRPPLSAIEKSSVDRRIRQGKRKFKKEGITGKSLTDIYTIAALGREQAGQALETERQHSGNRTRALHLFTSSQVNYLCAEFLLTESKKLIAHPKPY